MTDISADDPDVADLVSALLENTRRLVELEELAEIGSWQWDVRADAVEWSDEMYRLFGRTRHDMTPTFDGYLSCLHPDDRAAARRNVERALSAHEPFAADYRVVGTDGHVRWVHCRARAVTTLDGSVVRLIGTTQDVTDRKLLEERLAHVALHDDLTGLPTRTLLRDRLEHAMSRSDRTHLLTAVFFIDLDDFKVVNDRWGHQVGDAALRKLAARLSHAVRAADTVARYGGDEFVIVAEDLHWPEEGGQVADRILSASVFDLDEAAEGLRLTASIGATVVDGDGSPDDVLHEADTAMYRAKQAGGAQLVWYGAVR